MGFFVNADKDAFMFKLKNGRSVPYATVGDCCSESWIEHTSGVKELIGSVITGVDEKNLGSADGTRQEYDQKYSAIFKLDPPGLFEIEYRNSSNGYYGGNIELRYDRADSEMSALTEDL